MKPAMAFGALAATIGILCDDVAMPRGADWYRDAVARSRAAQPGFGPVYNGPTPCAFWKHAPREKPVAVDNGVPALLVQSTGDTHTPYDGALGMHAKLHASRLLTVPGRVHTVYLNGYSPCARAAVNALPPDRRPARHGHHLRELNVSRTLDR
ncbi:alpha/beta hydrolase [Kitasatospora sp. NPDC059722]|uniref:alpha/beta hydrolase n=1 Tax=Kitasatospora sp. NPDC059722 TaxID=3346925 RepID=UPI0036B14368